MKKLFIVLSLVLSTFFVTSCFNEVNPEKAIAEAMEKCFENVDLTKIQSDLVFKTTIDDVKVSYISSNEDVISNTGSVTKPLVDTTVQITVIFTQYECTIEKVYEVTVLGSGTLTLNQVKDLESNTPVLVKGIVARVIYGTEKNVPVGFYIFDETDAIYVYSSKYAEEVSVGNEVTISGTFTKYIDQNSATSAEKAGYTGAMQIVPDTLENDGKTHEVPTSFIQETSIADLCQIPVSENITSNVYKVVAKINKSQGNGFVNYYFNDLNGVDSYYAYTTANGKDLAWLEEYDGSVRECYIAIQNCKLSASGNFWRIVPIEILGEVEVNDETYMEYALDRLETQFATNYDNPCSFELVNVDSILESSNVTYTSNSEGVKIEETEEGYLATLDFGSEKVTMSVTITLTYNGKTLDRDVEFICMVAKPEIETITIEEARNVVVGEKAVVSGYIVGFLYMKGGTTPAGFELLDETSSIAVFVSTDVNTTTDITKLQVGEFVYVEGYGDLYQPRTDYNHNGSIRLNNAEVLYHDWQVHELPEGVIEEMSMADLVQNPSDNNISNMVFKTTMYVEKSSGSYVNYYIHDINDPSLSMIVYSQNSDSDGPDEYKWLDEYAGKCVEAYVTLRIGAKSNGEFIWKAGVLQILNVVSTPDSLLAAFEKENILNLFASEYASKTKVEYEIPEGATLTLESSSSKQVTAEVVDGVFTVNVAEPIVSEEVTLKLNLKCGEYEEIFEVSFTLTKAAALSLVDFREQAAKNGPTVVVEGVVTALVKNAGASTWTFYLSDETGTIFSYIKSSVEVGDKVRIQGQISIYYGLPQITNGTVTILSNNNSLIENSFVKNASLEDVDADSILGESAKMGGIVYKDVIGTIHVTGSGEKVYMTQDDVEIVMYNYTNTSYYTENYQELEVLNGKQIKATLISYNWYQTQYTYVIASYTVVE